MDRKPLVRQIEALDQSLLEISKRLGRLESLALTASFGSALSDEVVEHTNLLKMAIHAIHRLEQGVTQAEILEKYLELVCSFVPRSVLFLNQNQILFPWRSLGLELDDLAKVQVDDKGSLLARCVRQKSLIYAEDGKVKDFGWGNEGNPPKAAVGIPICFGELIPVLLYADSDQRFSPAGLEFLSLLVTLILKNHTLQHGYFRRERKERNVHTSSLASQNEKKASKEFRLSEMDKDDPEEKFVSDVKILEEFGQSKEDGVLQNFHVYKEEALRFARLLVLEIKLYNVEIVEQGRVSSNIYERLRLDIERGREMYKMRVHAKVQSQEDYYDTELVRILALGERGLLGSEYPGPCID